LRAAAAAKLGGGTVTAGASWAPLSVVCAAAQQRHEPARHQSGRLPLHACRQRRGFQIDDVYLDPWKST
jgi:hypothetical protein